VPHAIAWADIERKDLGVVAGSTTRDDDAIADTGDLGAVPRLKPVDCTTNPAIVLKAVETPGYKDVVAEALAWGRGQSGDAIRVAAATADRFAVFVGVELLRLVPGYVSTEVDGELSFNVAASVARTHQVIDAYKQRGVGPGRLLINSYRRGRDTSVAERPIALPRIDRGSAVMWPGDYSLVKPTTGQFTRFPVVFTGPPAGLTSKPDALLASRSLPSVISFR
jgi:hypothetical protein